MIQIASASSTKYPTSTKCRIAPTTPAKPEGADLPAEVRLEPGAVGVVPLHVVHHDRHDPGDADEKPDRLQRVHHRGDGLQGIQSLGIFHSSTPSMATRFALDFAPEMILTQRRGTLK